MMDLVARYIFSTVGQLILASFVLFFWRWIYQRARRTIIQRRKFLKTLFSGPQDVIPDLTLPERQLVILLGRLKTQEVMSVLYVWLVIISMAIRNTNQGTTYIPLFLAGLGAIMGLRLYAFSDLCASGVPSDSRRPFQEKLPETLSGKYRVGIDVQKVHDFNLPPSAQPFWDLEEVSKWLVKFGFEPSNDGNWIGSEISIRHLDISEIKGLEPLVEL